LSRCAHPSAGRRTASDGSHDDEAPTDPAAIRTRITAAAVTTFRVAEEIAGQGLDENWEEV